MFRDKKGMEIDTSIIMIKELKQVKLENRKLTKVNTNLVITMKQ